MGYPTRRTLAPALILAAALAWAPPGFAQQTAASAGPPPWWQAVAAIATFKALHLLPEWAGLEDDWRMLVSADSQRQVVCIRDRATGARWTTSGRLDRFIAGAQYQPGIYLDLWESNAQPRPRVPPADVALCWPDTVAAGPTAAGEPAYYSIACRAGCGPTGQVDWGATARSMAGASIAGEQCGPAPAGLPPPGGGYIWGEIRRLHAPRGAIALTRCLPAPAG